MAFTVYLLPAYPPTICSAQPSAVSPPYTLWAQSTYIYRAPQYTVRAPTPLPQAIVPSPRTKGMCGAHSPATKRVGGGESQFRRLEKKLSTLPTL
jgi:hypothetical protein